MSDHKQLLRDIEQARLESAEQAVVDNLRAKGLLPNEQPSTTPPASGAGSEQSQLFSRYSFAIVTGRYKILDNRSEGSPRIKQIATADGEDEARTIVRALNTTEQHSTLVEQRERLVNALKQMLSAFAPYANPDTEQWREEVEAYDGASSVLTTIEQEGETRG